MKAAFRLLGSNGNWLAKGNLSIAALLVKSTIQNHLTRFFLNFIIESLKYINLFWLIKSVELAISRSGLEYLGDPIQNQRTGALFTGSFRTSDVQDVVITPTTSSDDIRCR